MLWLLTFVIGNIALLTVVVELLFYETHFNWLIISAIIFLTYAYLLTEYLNYKNNLKAES